MAGIVSEIKALVAGGHYVFSRHAIQRSYDIDRPNQAEAVDILKSGWREEKFDEPIEGGGWKYRITGRARTGKEGSVVVTIITTSNGKRVLVITVF